MKPLLILLLVFCSSCAAISIAQKEMSKISLEDESYQPNFFRDEVPKRYSSINKLAQLESNLSEDEFEDYQAYTRYFRSNSERIQYLSLGDESERQMWLRSRGILVRENRMPSNIEAAIMRHDIVYGMTKDAVIQSWGEPSKIEYAGRGGYERWTYYSNPGLRDGKKYLYFENGSLSAWESF